MRKKCVLATLGPTGTCSEYCAKFFLSKEDIDADILLLDTFEATINELIEGNVNYVLIPSAYVKFAEIVFENLSRIKILKSFVYNTPRMVSVKKAGFMGNVKKIATHPSPSSLIINEFKDAEVIYAKSNSEAARMLNDGEVDACITTEICSDKYKFRVIKDFGVVSMSWNIFERVNVNVMECVSKRKFTQKGDIQEIYIERNRELIVNFISEKSLFQMHNHEEAQEVLGVDGQFQLIVGENSCFISEGDYQFIKSNIPHSAVPVTDFISIDVKKDMNISENKNNTKVKILKSKDLDNIINLSKESIIAVTKDAVIYDRNSECLLEALKMYKGLKKLDVKVKFKEDEGKLLIITF
ncbi:prephenate dehydratase domain-containing protein [Clostridium akagii]|uniref:prephenate dehydratase domain-containing protein n=1 Tax=Clostridium akagii TaxID=91623 RepID=UPI00047A7C9A|nr:prephenate dehydratase domain-containing protein [Clostridium akagii]